MTEELELQEIKEWLEELKEMKAISGYTIGEHHDDGWDLFVTPVKPMEYIQLNFKTLTDGISFEEMLKDEKNI